jgi:fructose-1,6-bisphosphatase/inositol monophosphatase family enzyme
MFKDKPTLDGMSDTLKRVSKPIKTSFHSLKKAKLDDNSLAVPTTSKDIISSLCDWARQYNASFVAGGKKIIHKEGSAYVIYLSPLDGTGPLLGRVASSTCVIAIMHIDGNGIGTPECAVIYDPINKQIWTAEAGRGVQFKDLYTNGTSTLHEFETEVSAENVTRIHVASWDKRDTQLCSISGKLARNRKYVFLNIGSTALAAGLMSLDQGGIHACLSTKKSASEIAAMSLIVNELGGTVTDLSGKPIVGFEYIEDTTDVANPLFDFVLPNGALLTRTLLVNKEIITLITPKRRT